MKNKYKVFLPQQSTPAITEDVLEYISEETNLDMDWERLEEQIDEMDLFDAILFEKVSIQRIL